MAAVLNQEGQKSPGPFEIYGVNHGPAFFSSLGEIGTRENGQMGRHRILGDAYRLGDVARSHPIGANLEQQPENLEAAFLCQTVECVDSLVNIHGSRTIELN